MAGQFRFKNSSGAIVAQISASNAGAMSFSGSAVDFSSVTSLTLGTSTLTGTASFATAAVSSSYSNTATSSSYALASTSASYGLNALTGSNAMTASSADTLYVRNNATVLGSITAQTLVVQTVTSSVDYVTGSTRFGSLQANTHIFTGSLSLTGSAAFLGGNVGVGTSSPATALHVDASGGGIVRATRLGAGSAYTQIEADGSNGTLASSTNLNINAGGSTRLYVSSSGNVGVGTSSPGAKLDVLGETRIQGGGSVSYAVLNMLDNTSGGSNWAIFSGYPSLGNFTIRESGVANHLVIAKTTGAATFYSSVTVGTSVYWGGTSNNNLSAGSISLVDSGTGTKYLQFSVSNTVANIATNYSNSNIPLTLNSYGNTNQIYLATDGKVGISTGTPARSLSIYNGSVGLYNSSTGQTSTDGVTFELNGTAGYLWNYENDSLILGTNNSERMRIGSDGTKYLGTYNTSRLQINASGEAIYQYTNNYYIYGFYNDANSLNIESAFAGNILFRTGAQTTSSSPTTTTERMRITSGGNLLMAKDLAIGINTADGTDDGYLALCGASADGPTRGGHIYLSGNERSVDPGHVTISAGNVIGIGSVITFRTAGTERMRLIGNGRLLIGTSTDQGYVLYVNGNAAGTSGFANVSDRRLKKDITSIENALNKVKLLNGVSFNWDKTLRPNLNLDDNNHLGLIAQDVEEVLPQVVTTNEDEMQTKTITYSDIVPVLVEAIKELSTKNDSLEARLAALENA